MRINSFYIVPFIQTSNVPKVIKRVEPITKPKAVDFKREYLDIKKKAENEEEIKHIDIRI